MTTLKRRWTRTGNRMAVWLFRRLGGRLPGPRNSHVLMITTPGRRTGAPRSTCIQYLETPAGLVVWGSGAGSRRDPDWFQNLRRSGTAQVQLRSDTFRVRPRELRGAERDAMWRNVILTQLPAVERYARKAGRPIPVAVLDRI